MKYGQVRALNAMLLDKYNKDEQNLKFYDHYLFHMSSMGLSLIREKMLNDCRISISQAFMLRSIIEDLAIMLMYDAGNISDDCEYLLMGFRYLCEYKIYKDYQELDGVNLDLKNMETNFKEARDEYKKIIGDDVKNREFRKIIRSNLPFLENDYKFDSLINLYCSDLIPIYRYLSLVIHPFEIETGYLYFEIESITNMLSPIFDLVIKEINKYYPNILSSYKHCWEYERNYCFGDGKNYSMFALEAEPEIRCLLDIAIHINTDLKISEEQSYMPAIFFERMAYEIESLTYDKCFGFSEIIKSKIKPIFELCAVFHHSITSRDSENTLMKAYSEINYLKILGKEYEKYISLLYPVYNKLMSIDLSLEEFTEKITKVSMPIFLGFESINSFVFTMIDDLIPEEKHQRAYFKMIYEESQLLSHGNGYMLTSNYGSFIDSLSALNAIDNLVFILFKEYSFLSASFNNKFQYDMKKYEKILNTVINKKMKTYEEIEKHIVKIQ